MQSTLKRELNQGVKPLWLEADGTTARWNTKI